VIGAGLIRWLLFGVGAWDGPTVAAVAAVLGLSSLAASYLPACRAASVNPVEALGAE
jgi:ABC-type lipoprotein release transport system permease subunit